MKLQFKEQQFQIQAVKAVVDCFSGQNRETKRFELEKSKEILRKAKAVAIGDTQVQVAFETEVMEGIGYRNRAFSIPDSQILRNIQLRYFPFFGQ